jgi:methylamine dehydrogenase heavy chain
MKFANIAKPAVAGFALALGSLFPAIPSLAAPASVEPEESDVRTLDAPKPGWFFIQRGFVLGGTSIFDTATGKILGQVETPVLSDMALDPLGKAYYVSQSIWTKGWRGTRQDFVTVYDSAGLKVQADIDMPGRLLVGGRKNNFVVSGDGKWGFVYNFSPASSVNVIDLAKRKFVKAIELPGCADIIPNPGVGFSSLCNDGSMATVSVMGAKPVITHTAPFFNATGDPVFDNFAYDKAKKQVVMLTYTGLVYTAAMGATPTVAEPFSIQQLAGLRKAGTEPLDVNWYPGGGQPMALHRASGHLFVLMHMGEYWTHKEGAEEIWDIDLAAKKVVKRVSVPGKPRAIEVTQDAAPQVIVAGEDESARIFDVGTWALKYTIAKAGSGPITVVEP